MEEASSLPAAGWTNMSLGKAKETVDETHVHVVDAPQPQIPVVIKALCYSIKVKGEEKSILSGVNCVFRARQMAAILGPSGSGKTTLLDLIAGRKTVGTASGLVLYGTEAPTRALLRRSVGYCEQVDTLIENLTVREMLLYTAQLKRPMSEPKESKQHDVNQLLSKLALDSCKDTKIGNPLKRGVSGGQAKRTNVAIALITNPRVLYLDEPTSGLDSYTANEVMTLVKSLVTSSEITIACTIHSPTSYTFALFDSCLVLVGGRVCFFGSGTGQAMLDYFERTLTHRSLNLGENMAGSISLHNTFLSSTFHSKCEAELASLIDDKTIASKGVSLVVGSAGSAGFSAYVTPPLFSLQALLSFRTLNNYRSMDYLGPRLFDKIIFGIIIMGLYWNLGGNFSTQNVPNLCALMYLCVAQPAWGAVSFIPAIVMERQLYVRERSDGLYRPIVYLFFKMIDELTVQWVVGLGSCGIIWGGARLTGNFWYFWLMLMATLSNGVAIAYSISALCSTMDIANAVVPTILAIMLFLSGFLIRIPDIPLYLRWLTWINLLKYSWGGLMVNQFESHPEATLGQGTGSILSYYGLDMDKWAYLGIVVGLFFGWTFLCWVGLTFINHQKR